MALATVLRKEEIGSEVFQNHHFHGCKLLNCKLVDCELFYCNVLHCRIVRSSLQGTIIQVSSFFGNCQVAYSPFSLDAFPPEVRAILFSYALAPRDTAWSACKEISPLLPALRVSKKSFYKEAIQIYYSMRSFMMEPSSSYAMCPPIAKSTFEHIGRLFIKAKNFDKPFAWPEYLLPETTPLADSSKAPILTKHAKSKLPTNSRVHTVTVSLDNSYDLPPWARRALETFSRLKTFQIRQPVIDLFSSEAGPQGKIAKAVQDGCFIFGMPGSFDLSGNDSTFTWTWTGSLGRSFEEIGRKSPRDRALGMLRRGNRSILVNYTDVSV